MKNLLTTIIIGLLIVFGTDQVQAEQPKDSFVPTPAQSVEQLKKLDKMKKATAGLTFAIGTGATGVALYAAKAKVETGTNQYIKRRVYDAYRSRMRPHPQVKEPWAVELNKLLPAERVPDNFTVETVTLKYNEPFRGQSGISYVAGKTAKGFLVGFKGTGKNKSLPDIIFRENDAYINSETNARYNKDLSSNYEKSWAEYLNAKGKPVKIYNTEDRAMSGVDDWAKLFEKSQKNYKTAQTMKVGSYALFAITGAALIYSAYQLWTAEDPEPSAAAIAQSDIKALVAHDYSKPLPANLVQLLQDKTLRTSVDMTTMMVEDVKGQGAF